MTKYLDNIKGNSQIIENKACELRRLGSAFYLAGNHELARKLGDIAEDLDEARKSIDSAVSINLTDRFSEIQQSSVNMINACLATVKL